MPDVKYIDAEGYAWLKRVRDTAKPNLYGRGVTIGPPDLAELGLPEDELKVLQEALVDAWLVNAPLIRGSAAHLYTVVQQALPRRDTAHLVQHIKSIYQRAYYKE